MKCIRSGLPFSLQFVDSWDFRTKDPIQITFKGPLYVNVEDICCTLDGNSRVICFIKLVSSQAQPQQDVNSNGFLM